MANVPYNCTDSELNEWVESQGFRVKGVRVIRDLVAGVSPGFAYVDLIEGMDVQDAADKLNGQTLRKCVVMVSEAKRRRAVA
jgi:hypothetical protein